MSRTQDTWAFLYKRNKATPYLGSFHASDLVDFFSGNGFIGTDILINFANTLDPNAPTGLAHNISYLSNTHWDKWSSSPLLPPLLTFLDPAPTLAITHDTYRVDAMSLLTNLSLKIP